LRAAGLAKLRADGADLVLCDVTHDVGWLISCLAEERIACPVIACGRPNDADAAVRALVGDLAVTLVPDAALAPGDARASWQGGGAEFDLAKRRAAVAEALSAAGLDLQPDEQKG